MGLAEQPPRVFGAARHSPQPLHGSHPAAAGANSDFDRIANANEDDEMSKEQGGVGFMWGGTRESLMKQIAAGGVKLKSFGELKAELDAVTPKPAAPKTIEDLDHQAIWAKWNKPKASTS